MAANLRRLRKARQLSLDALSKESGVGRATLARLEAGRANPTIETLYAVADALGVTLSDLLSFEDEVPTHVVRAGEAARVAGAIEASVLGRLGALSRAELLAVRFLYRRKRLAEPHAAGVVEHLLVTHGRAEVGPVDETFELAAGDYIRFRGDVEHIYCGLEPDSSAIAVMAYPANS